MVSVRVFYSKYKSEIIDFPNIEKMNSFISKVQPFHHEVLQATDSDILALAKPEKEEAAQEENEAYSMQVDKGQTAGIAPDEPQTLNGFRLIADFTDKHGKKIDSIDVNRDTETDTIHIKIELL